MLLSMVLSLLTSAAPPSVLSVGKKGASMYGNLLLSMVLDVLTFPLSYAAWTVSVVSAGVASLRKTTLHNDAQNSRSLAGRKMSRRTQTGLPVGGESKCRMGISVRVDPRGFHLVGGLGCSLHTGHRHVGVEYTRLPTRFITAEEKELITDVAQAHAGYGAVRNLHYYRSGICLTTQQVAYISGMQEALEHSSGVSSCRQYATVFPKQGNRLLLLASSPSTGGSVFTRHFAWCPRISGGESFFV